MTRPAMPSRDAVVVSGFNLAFEAALTQLLLRSETWTLKTLSVESLHTAAIDADLLILSAALPDAIASSLLTAMRAGSAGRRPCTVISLDIGGNRRAIDGGPVRSFDSGGDEGIKIFSVTSAPLAVDVFNPDQTKKPQLLPEELAHLLVQLADIDIGDTCIHLEPGSDREPPFAATTSGSEMPAAPEIPFADPVEKLFRKVLRVPSSLDLSSASLGETPGWDSLKHLELLLQLETEFQIHFTSTEMERLHRYSSLHSACLEKLSATR